MIGAGTLVGSAADLEELNEQIEIFRKIAPDAPLSIGILGFALQQRPDAWENYRKLLETHRPDVIECFAPAIVYEHQTGVSNVDLAHANNAKFIAQVGTIADARMALEAKVDAIIAQGTESGGHGLRREAGNSVLPLASQIRRLTEELAASNGRVPVVAAGSIVNGRTVAAALAVCDGAVLGTRLWATHESIGNPALQAALVAKNDDGSSFSCDNVIRTPVFDQILNALTPVPWPLPYDSVGALRNNTTQKWDDRLDSLANEISSGTVVQEFKAAMQDGNPKVGMVLAGQGVGEIDSIEPAFDIIMRIEQETKDILQELSQII